MLAFEPVLPALHHRAQRQREPAAGRHSQVEYLHERSVLLEEGEFSPEQRQALGQAVMREEDDWLDWKASREMLESWLGLRQEVIA